MLESCKRYLRRRQRFVNYTDLGDYPSDNLERPGFKRMMTDVAADNLDVIVVITLDKITTDIDLLLETYKTIRKT